MFSYFFSFSWRRYYTQFLKFMVLRDIEIDWLYDFEISGFYSGVYTIYTIVCEYFCENWSSFHIYLTVKEYKTQSTLESLIWREFEVPDNIFYICCNLVLWFNLKHNRKKNKWLNFKHLSKFTLASWPMEQKPPWLGGQTEAKGALFAP